MPLPLGVHAAPAQFELYDAQRSMQTRREVAGKAAMLGLPNWADESVSNNRSHRESAYICAAHDLKLRPIRCLIHRIVVRRTCHLCTRSKAVSIIESDEAIALKSLDPRGAGWDCAFDEARVWVRGRGRGVRWYVDYAGTCRAALIAGVHAGLHRVGHEEAVVVA